VIRTLTFQAVLSSRATRGICFFFFCVLLFALPASAQLDIALGTPSSGTFSGGPDIVNLGNNNVHITIPILHKAGRGTNFQMDVTYDTSVWFPVTGSGSTFWSPVSSSGGVATWGWQGIYNNSLGYLTYQEIMVYAPCNPPNDMSQNSMSIRINWTLVDQSGSPHIFSGSTPGSVAPRGGCTTLSPPPLPLSSVANDGSGYSLYVATGGGVSVYDTSGKTLNLPINPAGPPQNWSTADRNGNVINGTSSGLYYDTLGNQVLTQNLVYTAPGGTAQFVRKYTSLTVQTAFGCSVSEYGPFSYSLLTEIDLPDYNSSTNPNSRYLISYEPTPSHSGNVTGRIASITLPTGGLISYSYSGGSHGIVCADGTAATLTRTTPDGIWTYARSQISGPHWQTTVTDPAGNVTVIDFQEDSGSTPTFNFYETNRQVYQGSVSPSNLLRTTYTCYNGATSPCTGTIVKSPLTQKTVTTILPGASNLQSKTNTTYDSYGNVTEVDEYDFGSGAPPSTPLRKTITSYAVLYNYIYNMPSSVVIEDGSGNLKAQTTYAYDETSVVTTSGTPQHNGITGHRGNATTIKRYKDSSNFLTTTATYFDTGMVQTVSDANGGQTTYTYQDSTSTCGNAFPTGITEAISTLTQSYTWSCPGGVQLTSKDENRQTTTTTYSDAFFWRPASVSYPDGGQTIWAYNSPTSVTTTTKMNASQNIVTTQLLDGLGRKKRQQMNSDPQGVVYTDTTYDTLGRVYTVSNPYRSTSDPTYGLTTYGYDALSRTKSVTLPDGSIAGNSYSNNTITATDPAGKKRQGTTDSLGRSTQMTEDPGGLGYVTSYSYDALSNLTGVTQNGSRQRTYVYDALSRLTSETNPESGTVTYGYDASGHSGDLTSRVAPAPNQTGSSTVTTTYTYDALHRVTLRSYSDGSTPTATFYYDEHTHGVWSMTNPVGRLTVAYAPTSSVDNSEVFSYDPMGRVIAHAQAGALDYGQSGTSGAYNVDYAYDFAGNLTSEAMNGWEFPSSGVTLSYAYNSASQPTSVTSNLVDSQHPSPLATVDPSVGYYPTGALRKILYGNGLTQAISIESRLQPCRINLNSSGAYITDGCADGTVSGTVQDFYYAYGNWGTTNSGNVTTMAAGGAQNFSRTYTYDTLNRLGTMSDSNSGQQCRGLSWTYDAWGNRTDQTHTAGTCPTFHQTVDTKNRLVGPPYLYDAAGNMIYDGTHWYTYDAENRMTQVDSGTTASYAYMPEGRRTTKISGGSTHDYVYDLSNNVIAEMTSSGWQVGNVYLGGQMIAEYKNSTTYFVHQDHLGSTRLVTGLNQAPVQNLDYFPYGELNSTNSGITTHEFTGDERDAESGLDHTQFRQYSSSMARWMTPDPAGLAAVDPTNPQSWNRYSYVLNNPLAFIDPSGLDCIYLVEDANPVVRTGDCRSEGDDGYYVPGTVAGIVTSDGQITGVTLVGGDNTSWPVGFDYNSSPSSSGNSSWIDWSWWGTAAKTFFTEPYRKPGQTFTACWNRAASDTLVGMGVPREATPGTEALLGSAGAVGLFSSVKSIWALGNWVRPSSYLAKITGGFGFGSAGAKAARLGGKALAVPIAAEVGLRTGAALDCAIPVN
jgi:RHS repeat-associated protein